MSRENAAAAHELTGGDRVAFLAGRGQEMDDGPLFAAAII